MNQSRFVAKLSNEMVTNLGLVALHISSVKERSKVIDAVKLNDYEGIVVDVSDSHNFYGNNIWNLESERKTLIQELNKVNLNNMCLEWIHSINKYHDLQIVLELQNRMLLSMFVSIMMGQPLYKFFFNEPLDTYDQWKTVAFGIKNDMVADATKLKPGTKRGSQLIRISQVKKLETPRYGFHVSVLVPAYLNQNPTVLYFNCTENSRIARIMELIHSKCGIIPGKQLLYLGNTLLDFRKRLHHYDISSDTVLRLKIILIGGAIHG